MVHSAKEGPPEKNGPEAPALAEENRRLAAELSRLRAREEYLTGEVERLRGIERRYRQIAETISDTLHILDMNLATLYVSPAVERLRGYPVEEVMKQDLRDMLTPDSYRAAVGTLAKRLELEGPGWPGVQRPTTLELEQTRKDGTTVWTEVNAAFLRGADGRAEGIVAVSRDLTERRRLEAQLLQAQKMEAVGTLAGGMAHDFNNVMTAIQGLAEYSMSRVSAQDALHADLEQIRRSAARAAKLVRQLLVFSRRQPARADSVDLNRIAADLLKMLHRLLGEDVRVETRLGAGLWPVWADAGQLEQVIVNFAVNARDAMPHGGRILIETSNENLGDADLRAMPEARPGVFVRLAIADTGTGMDEQVLRRIFEPFFTTKVLGKGTGLGLSTVFGIVKQHNGWIHPTSRPGQGSVFAVYLPAYTSPVPRDDSEVESLEDLRGGGERILLVEDEQEVRDVARRVLEENGYEVHVAADAEEAFRLHRTVPGGFHLLFADVVLPGESGIRLVDRVLEEDPHLPALLCSGYLDVRSQWESIREKGYAFLQKPYALGDVLRAVRAALRSRGNPPA